MTALTLLAVHLDIGSGKYGTIHGVDGLAQRFEALCPNCPVWTIVPDNDANDLVYKPPMYPDAKYIEALTAFFENTMTPATQKVLASGSLPVVISSNHANAIGNLSAFLNHHQGKQVGVLWIDAHSDLHSVYTTPSGNVHGMPLSLAIGEDNLECAVHTVNDSVAAYWQRLKELSHHKLDPSNLFFLGLRSYEPPEAHLIDKHEMFAYSATEHRQDFDKVLQTLAARLETLDAVYVSFDVDALDDSLIPATGTPEPQGYRVDEVHAIFDRILTLPNVGLFEITEFNPTLDNDEQKHQHIYELFDGALGLLANR